MKSMLLIATLLLYTLNSKSQDSLTVEDIDRITATIDANKKSTKDEYCDTLQLEVVTHYCEESITDPEKDLLYRFTIKTVTDKNTLTVYYFHNNELIKVLNEERSRSKLLKRRVLYYRHGQVIHDVAEGVHPSPEYFLQAAQEKVKELMGITSN
jgi:hypothetical protein